MRGDLREGEIPLIIPSPNSTRAIFRCLQEYYTKIIKKQFRVQQRPSAQQSRRTERPRAGGGGTHPHTLLRAGWRKETLFRSGEEAAVVRLSPSPLMTRSASSHFSSFPHNNNNDYNRSSSGTPGPLSNIWGCLLLVLSPQLRSTTGRVQETIRSFVRCRQVETEEAVGVVLTVRQTILSIFYLHHLQGERSRCRCRLRHAGVHEVTLSTPTPPA